MSETKKSDKIKKAELDLGKQAPKKEQNKSGTVSLTSLVEEDACFLGRIPLEKFKECLEKKAEEGIVMIDFHANGYITDSVLRVLRDVLCNEVKQEKYLQALTTIDLTGCFNITDIGVGWLADVVVKAGHINQVRLDGCTHVTDSGYSAIFNAKSTVNLSVLATSVTYLNRGASMRGCPLLTDPKNSKDHTELPYGQSVIVPHSGLETSFADYLWKKENGSRSGRQLCHVKSWKLSDWKLALNEMERSNPLFDVLVPSNPSQVLIPFDAATDLGEIRSHIANTITRVLTKETINPFHKKEEIQQTLESKEFMDIHVMQKLDFTPDGLLRNISISEKVIGVFCSRQPLSCSNNYYEIEVISTDGTKEIGLVMGCMFDVLFSDRNPMEASERKGGAVEGFEFEAGDVYGFGVEGEWESEYVPRDKTCTYYFTKNGSRMTEKTVAETPHIGMYPLISLLGKGVAQIRLRNLNSPPQSLVDKWEKEKKTFEPCFLHNVLCDENGILSYSDSYKTVQEVGLCVNQHPVTKANNSLTIRVVNVAENGNISLGLGAENYRLKSALGRADGSVGYSSGSGEVHVNGSVQGKGPVWKNGDEVTVTVTDFTTNTVDPSQKVTVVFSVNGSKVLECSYPYKAILGNRCVFLISMTTPKEQVEIVNFRQPYRSQPPMMDKLTMGRSHFINVFDDGRLQYRHFDSRNSFGLFVSKTPFNKQLGYFEMQVLETSTHKHIGIGACHRDYKINNMPGWLYGSVAYHADNGQLYLNSAHGSRTINQDQKEIVFQRGDIVGCGIVMETTKFTADGRIEPQQELDFYFTKNGTRMHECKFLYQSDGLFPCVALHYTEDLVQLFNFYPGCHPVIKEKEKKKVTADQSTEGCQFVMVSVGTGKAVDEKAKLQLLENQLNLEQDLTSITDIKLEIQRLEKNLGTLDFQGQNYYSHLCWNLECLERICHHKDRLHFLSVNTKTGEGYDMLVKKIVSLHNQHKKNYPMQYDVHTFVKKGLDSVMSVVESNCIVRVSKLQELTANVFEGFGHVYLQAVKTLHKMGRLLCLKLLSSDYVAVDLQFLQRMFERLTSAEKGQADKRITAVGEGSLLWTEETITSATKLEKEQLDLLKQLLLRMGLLRLPGLRTDPTDPPYLYTQMHNIVSSNRDMSDYWSAGSRPANTVMMWRTYQFLARMPAEMLSTVITLCSQYARLQLVRKDCGVLQNGAVQTSIVKHTIDNKVDALTIESKCYMPDSDMGPINDDTRYHVEEYTWNVFCILADVIDGHIENWGLCPIIKQDLPHWFEENTYKSPKEDVYSIDLKPLQSICTVCELCCDKGSDCKWNGIVGHYLRQCQCGTKVTGCKSCGICKRCAEQLWTLRSSLRPCCEVSRGERTEMTDAISLNGVTYNTVDCINLHMPNQPICLKKQNDTSGALIQVFPGPAVEIPERKKLTEYNKKPKFVKSHQFNPGDTVTVTLQEIKRDASQLQDLDQEDDDILEIRPVYHTLICREARVWHETGIVCYDSPSSAIPVAQFVGARPLSEECNKFSLEVVNPGEGRYIAIGLVHKRYPMNRQPGWDPSSIGYHADDGGVFVGSGWPLRRVGAVQVGEIMTCELNIEEQKVAFYKGEEQENAYKSPKEDVYSIDLKPLQVYKSTKLRIPAGGFYPCVALHSPGEALRLLDFDTWLPPKDVEVPTLPQAFDTYKYGNLWISPGHTISLQRMKSIQGWLLLHNPSKDLVGYVVTSDPPCIDHVNHLDSGKSNTIWIQIKEKDISSVNKVEIVWFSLDSGKTYTVEEIKQIHATLTTESYHTHTLKVRMLDTQVSNVINLTRAAEQEPSVKDMYLLKVSRNGSLVDTYYLKAGKYNCIMPRDSDVGKYGLLLRYPRFPTFDQPNMFQRGMRLIAQPVKNTYAECVIADATHDGYGLTLEYSPKHSEDNTLLCIESESDSIQLEELPLEVIEEMSTVIKGEKEAKKEEKGDNPGVSKGDNSGAPKADKSDQPKASDKTAEVKLDVDLEKGADDFLGLLSRSKHVRVNVDEDEVDDASAAKEKKKPEKKEIVMADVEIFGFESRGNMAVEKRAYMFPPPYLLTPASRYAIMALDSKWKTHSLESIAKCYSVPTRITVQELQITELSRKLPRWVKGRPKDRAIDQAFVFLPSSLDTNKLCHSSVPKLFQDVEVHRLCFLIDQMYHMWQDGDEVTLDIPIHFVDMPPIKPQNPLPANLLYGNLMSGWNYSTLTATKLNLPVYDKVFSGGKPDFSRQQVETMLGSLLRVYTAQCHILAEQYGGMDLQDAFPKRSKEIQKSIAHSDNNVRRFKGELVDDPSIMLMRKFKSSVMCKAHQLSLEAGTVMEMAEDNEFHYEHKYYEPYQETVNFFCRELSHQTSLPDDFFSKFPNLQVFALEQCWKLTAVPSGVSQCSRLKIVSLTASAIKDLPSDILLAPELVHLHCTDLPVKSLPAQWPASSQLTDLVLSGLQLTKVPVEICKLQELTTLNLSCNPLSDIPVEIGQLQKLKVLNLSGMPWVTLGGSRQGLSRDQYEVWFTEHPYVQTFLGNFDSHKMFLEHDLNKNGTLDEEELAALNLKFFWDIPRMGSNCICDSEYGGIPPAVFLITSLEELHLNYTAITAVPVHMCRLVNLHIISLDYNPLLESLPGSLGHLPNIKSLNLLGCPSLRTPPNEVVSRGFESVKAYLKRLAGGFTACRRTKLMLVGLGGAGKTSLLKALMSQNKKTEGTKGEDITDGIVIQPWTVKTNDGLDITYNTWDFAGQTLYYNTHQFFLSKRAVYILLWSTRQGFEHAGLDFWLSSIACHAPKTPIFVVGTHCDQVPKADIPMAALIKRYPQICGFHFVSSLKGTGVAELEEKLLEVTLEQKNMGEKIPQVWLNLEHKILAARTETSILKWSIIKEYGMEVGIYDEKDIKEAIQFLHELGTVQYFDNDFLRDQVVINPQWIVNVMSCVVSVKNSPIQEHKGRFHHKYINEIWSQYPDSLHQWLLQLTEEFDLTFPLPKDPVNIVPCLLPQEEPEELDWSTTGCCGDNRQTKMVYKFAYLPAGLFNRAQVRLFQFSDGKLIWKRGSMLKKNNHLALIRQISDSELVVLVQGPRPENILFLVHEIFESLIDESFHGVVYDFMVPCPDCVMKEGCLDPCLFESELIAHAKDNKAPFLQCRKYFHTVSMAQLLEIMPNDHASDFDAHLQHSIMMLQDLNKALTMDVAILYSAVDVPTPKENGDKVHPAWVKDDLEKMGLTCWFCEDMLSVSIQDLTLGLKHCKVVVALVSDNFERDEKCRDMMMYAMDTLSKDYVITVIGNSLAWQNTDLGMRIGKQEQMVMVKTKARYPDRIKDLQDVVKQKLHGIQIRENKEYPVCFVSYCWSNSQDAVSKGTKPRQGSLGWGDPRVVKKYLEDSGISTWIDCEQMTTGKGLFENICQGMRHARVLVVCVSDEYVESENCMMELRFGVLNLELPLVLAVVGTGKEWKYSEVGILAQRARASKVYLQKENPSALETLLSYVKERLPQAGDTLIRKEAVKKEMSEMQKKASRQTNVVLQEEYELTQRRFMRHIISFVSSMDSTPMPRLVVIDFDKTERVSSIGTSPAAASSRRSTSRSVNMDSFKPDRESTSNRRSANRSVNMDSFKPDREGSRDSMDRGSKLLRPTLRPKTASKSRERIEALRPETEEWESENFCIKLLCEFEEGWHLCEQSFPLRKTEELKNQLQKVAPYLARLFAILKQSSMQLSCHSGDTGKQFVEWLDKESQNSDFLEAYQAMRAIISEHEQAATPFLNQLSRCHLPSGKVFWLCEKHQSGPRITKLSRDVGTRLNQRRVIFREDILLKELIEKSAIYLKKKGDKSKTKKISLPPPDKSKTASKKIEHKPSTTNLSHSTSKDKLIPPGADNSSNNMPPVRGAKDGKKKEVTSPPPPAKMHPVNRTIGKAKFKATGTAAELATASKKDGSKDGSKACSIQ